MVIDQRQLEVDAIMDTLIDAVRYNVNAIIPGVSQREHKQWIARNPAPEENRSLIGNTDFKPLAWLGQFIKLPREKPKKKRR